jgi:hypothetical protein
MKASENDRTKALDRFHTDNTLKPETLRVWEENLEVYNFKKVWRQMNRRGLAIAKCTTAQFLERFFIVKKKSIVAMSILLFIIIEGVYYNCDCCIIWM